MAKKKGTIPTPKYTSAQIKAEYRKQRKRITSFLSRATKKGYVFEENILPKIPKTITEASVRRLQKLTAKAMYERAVWAEPETGEALPARFGKQRAIKEGILKRKGLVPHKAQDMYEEPDFEEAPTVDLWMNIREQLIMSFPEHKIYFERSYRRGAKPRFFEGEPRLNELLNIWQETYDTYGGNYSALNDYVSANEEGLSDALSKVNRAVYEDELESGIAEIARWLLMGKSLTVEQGERLADMTALY